MAVRVIEEKPDPSVVKQVVCRTCGVKLEYVPQDVQSYQHTDYGGGTDTYKYITCPKCSEKVFVQ